LSNEEQPPQQPEQSPQQAYYGWQYDQDQQAGSAGAPQPHTHSPQPPYPGQPAAYPPSHGYGQGWPGAPPPQLPQLPQPPQQAQQPQAPLQARYAQPVQDMGASLGYGQGMEYQYFNAPQPSQPLPQLRQARLQQLREERMRRMQQRVGGVGGAGRTGGAGSSGGIGGSVKDLTNLVKNRLRASSERVKQAEPLEEMSPSLLAPPDELSPSLRRPPNLPPVLQNSPAALPGRGLVNGASGLNVPARAGQYAQDTGMLQRAHIGRATMILTGAFIASRILGLLRTSIFAYVFGTSATSDAFLQAFLVPDLIFNIVAGGALSSAFIPVFTQYLVGEQNERKAWHIASSALNIAIAIMIVLAGLAIIFAPQIVPLYNPGLNPAVAADRNELDLIVSLSRIMFLQSIILGGGVIVTSILNARQDFLLPAIGTVLYNVGLIAGLLPGIFIVADRSAAHEMTAVFLATWGVVLGAILQVIVQIPGLFKVGMRFSPAFDYRHPGVVQIGRQMVPRVINAAMLYFSTFVDRGLILLMVAGLSQFATNGYITQYYQAFQLVLLPLGVFGMAISTAAFPTLAENVTVGRMDRVRAIIQDTLRTILFMSIPSSVGLIVLGLPIIQVLLQHGAYSLASAQGTAVPLAFFAIGLAGLASVEILTRSFYAMRDSRTPVLISIAQFIFKIALSIIFILIAINWGIAWGLGALACATSIAGLLEALVLLWVLHERVGGLNLRAMRTFVGRVLLAALAMGVAIFVLRLLLDLVLNTNHDRLGVGDTLLALIKLLLELATGILVYIRATRLLGIEDFWKQGPVKRVLDRLRLSWL
jgi:putative peptidoglycan lipid II flippase